MGCREATHFHRAGWQQIIESVFRHRTHFLYVEEAGRIVGVLPLAHVNSWLFGSALVSLPFAVYGGVGRRYRRGRGGARRRRRRRWPGGFACKHLELRNVAARHADWPTQDLYVTFRKEILPDVEANMLAIPRKQRAMVRKGAKNGLTSEIDPTADRFFALFADNVHRHGTPALPKTYFEALLRVFAATARC